MPERESPTWNPRHFPGDPLFSWSWAKRACGGPSTAGTTITDLPLRATLQIAGEAAANDL